MPVALPLTRPSYSMVLRCGLWIGPPEPPPQACGTFLAGQGICEACRIWRHLERLIPQTPERALPHLLGVLDNTARLATAVGVMNEIMQDLNRDGGKTDGGAATPDWGKEDG